MKLSVWPITGLLAGVLVILSGCGEEPPLAGKYELTEGRASVSLILNDNGTYLYCRPNSQCDSGSYRVTHVEGDSGAYVEFSGVSIKKYEGEGATVSYNIFGNPDISFGDPDSTTFKKVVD